MDPSVEAETTAWLNHLVGSFWGGRRTTALVGGAVGEGEGGDAVDGLSSFISE